MSLNLVAELSDAMMTPSAKQFTLLVKLCHNLISSATTMEQLGFLRVDARDVVPSDRTRKERHNSRIVDALYDLDLGVFIHLVNKATRIVSKHISANDWDGFIPDYLNILEWPQRGELADPTCHFASACVRGSPQHAALGRWMDVMMGHTLPRH